MLRRAKRLQSIFDEFCAQYDQSYFALSREEWRQIEYLLCITEPFFKFTTALSKTRDVTIYRVLYIYNRLYDHLDHSIRQLQRKNVPWKKVMLTALHAAKRKLSHYYGMTDDIDGDLYAIGTIIVPQHKLQFFSSKDWDEPGQDWRRRYRKSLEDRLELYKQRPADLPLSKAPSFVHTQDELALICDIEESQEASAPEQDELMQYLESGEYYYIPVLIRQTNLACRYYTNSSSYLLERPST